MAASVTPLGHNWQGLPLAVRENPPTFTAATVALLGSAAADLHPYVEALPVLSGGTATLALYTVVGVLGGVVGKATQRWSTPWYAPPVDDD